MTRLALCALVALTLVGCPKEKRAQEVAATSISLTAEVLAVADSAFTELYSEAANKAADKCTGGEDSRACFASEMRKWDKASQAFVSSVDSLYVLQSALKVWQSGSPNGEQDFRLAASCFLRTLSNLDSLLEGVDVKLPNLKVAINIGASVLAADPEAVCA